MLKKKDKSLISHQKIEIFTKGSAEIRFEKLLKSTFIKIIVQSRECRGMSQRKRDFIEEIQGFDFYYMFLCVRLRPGKLFELEKE